MNAYAWFYSPLIVSLLGALLIVAAWNAFKGMR